MKSGNILTKTLRYLELSIKITSLETQLKKTLSKEKREELAEELETYRRERIKLKLERDGYL